MNFTRGKRYDFPATRSARVGPEATPSIEHRQVNSW